MKRKSEWTCLFDSNKYTRNSRMNQFSIFHHSSVDINSHFSRTFSWVKTFQPQWIVKSWSKFVTGDLMLWKISHFVWKKILTNNIFIWLDGTVKIELKKRDWGRGRVNFSISRDKEKLSCLFCELEKCEKGERIHVNLSVKMEKNDIIYLPIHFIRMTARLHFFVVSQNSINSKICQLLDVLIKKTNTRLTE